ncbi:MAG: helicase-related protein, partial [Alphaproteobacteria bacterium]
MVGSPQSRVVAILGPTNTGKTHLALERMLGHESGIIGLPLRLLAREIYDRVVAAKGAATVALVTGEEKIVPPRPRWFVCTTEAMPVDRSVDFVAVDEVQLAADDERGHVFTDRILNARGRSETLFLGADTIRPLLRKLAPEAEYVARPRFSRLGHAGYRKITRLPRRSAVVAFSAAEVYRAAEMLRSHRGGAAVVLGALSPRARNAQVALFQAGEVDYLVATDAIGMGLNMDVDHVAFAGLRKFDGIAPRDLEAPEIAQIAGRAGRYMNDGTFGTTGEVGALDPAVVAQVEAHRFPVLTRLRWRNGRLAFGSLGALLASLDAPAPHPFLMRQRRAVDHLAAATLARDADIARRAADPEGVRLLWDVCRIPDYRKTLAEAHARLLDRIFR